MSLNSASNVAAMPDVIQPEESNLMSYPEYWEKHNIYGTASPDDQFFVRLLNFFTGEGKRVKNEYEAYQNNYINNLNARNAAKAAQSANAFEDYMSSTAYSRGFRDLERAGINSYLLLNSGSTPATSAGSSSKPEYSYSKADYKDSKNDSKGRDLALIMLAIARIAAAL